MSKNCDDFLEGEMFRAAVAILAILCLWAWLA